MDIKYELGSKYALCQGCLSSNRKTRRVIGRCYSLFFELLGEHKNTVTDTRQLLLCWECTALLNKLQTFQKRIQCAQSSLVQYLHSLRHEEPNTLSTLCFAQPKEYDLELTEKLCLEITEQAHITEKIHHKLHETLNIKEETRDNISIKDEDYESIDYNETTDYKYELDNNMRNETVLNENKKYYMKNNKKYPVIVKNTELNLNDVDKYFEMVCLNETEIEIYLGKRERNQSSTKKPYNCKECNIHYIRHIDILRHQTFHHQKNTSPYKCLACGIRIETEGELREHWRIEHTQMKKCTICSEICRSKGECRKHFNRYHTKEFDCTRCDVTFNTLRQFHAHCKKQHEVYICDYCGKRWLKKRSLEKHIICHHLPPYCRKCKKTYASYHVLKTHTRLYHPELLSGEIRPELAYCVECDRQYPSVDQYRRHLRQSIKHRPKKVKRIPCPVCGKVFSRTNYMNNHYKMVHNKATNHYCAQCNKYYVTAYALRTHIEHVHQKITLPKDKICDLCGRGFSTNRILANHRRTHTGERPYKCKYCPASFAQQTAMNTHQRTQHKNVISLELSTVGPI